MDALSFSAYPSSPGTVARPNPVPRLVIFCRLPGLLALAAHQRQSPQQQISPIVISEGRIVRDACALALAQRISVGISVVQARRLCPTLLAVPLEAVDVRQKRAAFLDVLADMSPIIEPHGLDAAYVDLTGSAVGSEEVTARLVAALRLTPIVGLGFSRLAAQACAESGVDIIEDAMVDWLWPDDLAVSARLKRLGLNTFGAVAEVGEEALRLHFGKVAPLLYRRAHGEDLTPIRALYPPPSVNVTIDCSDAPVDNRERLQIVIARASKRAEVQLRGLGVGRRLILLVQTERAEIRQEWEVPAPLEHASDIQRAVWRMLGQTRLTSPITHMRLVVEDVSFPTAHTSDLFGVRADSVSLEATRRRLAARFGLTTLMILGKQPRTVREKRRAAVQEFWGTHP